MTRSRWLIPCAALLLGSTAWGQEPSPARDCRMPMCGPQHSCQPQATEAARAPYYHELPQLLYPINYVDSGTCESNGCGPRDEARRESRKQRVASELLKFVRFYYRTGQYHTAEVLARKALELDPSNIAAEHAATLARLMISAAHEQNCRDGAEECDVNNEVPAPGCGMCRMSGEALMKLIVLRGETEQLRGMCHVLEEALKKALESKKANCACDNECKCCQDPKSCDCGDKCPCKKSAKRQRVSAPSCPVQQFISVPMCCPNIPAQCPMMCPMPPQVMAPAPPMMCPPCMPGCCMAGCPMPPGLTPCQVPVPEPVPMPTVSVPEAMLQMAVNHVVHQTKPVIHIDVRDGQVHIVSQIVEICCDSATPTPDGRALLQGNVCATFRGEQLPAKICAQCMIVNLDDGSYEVNPPNAAPQALHQVGFKIKHVKFGMVKPACVCPASGCSREECKPVEEK